MTTELDKRGRALEEAFFNKKDGELLAKLRAQDAAKRKQGELAGATGIRDSAVLAELVAEGIGGDTLTALALAPIVLMAWRKGKVEPAEKNAILRAAEGRGVAPRSSEWVLIEGWLERRPSKELRPAWEAYVGALRGKLSPAEFAKLRDDILTRAREVARAAGGFLGFASVSAEERQMIAELEKALSSIKGVEERVWAFDLEWVPDPLAGRLLRGVPDSASDEESLQALWLAGGATADDPTPFLKTVLCRIVSVAVVERRERGPEEPPLLNLLSLPRDPTSAVERGEAHIVGTFLEALGKHHPQLVGFNSQDSDLKILVQRAIVLGLQAAGFAHRPDKPWEGVDYFARNSEWNVDLKTIVGGWGKSVPSLHEIAVQSGIPGKLDVDGNDVARLWLAGRHGEIVAYNEMDALTTYLVWLRLAHFAGHVTREDYAAEQELVRALIEREIAAGKTHLKRYREEWERLAARVSTR